MITSIVNIIFTFAVGAVGLFIILTLLALLLYLDDLMEERRALKPKKVKKPSKIKPVLKKIGMYIEISIFAIVITLIIYMLGELIISLF